MPTYSIRSHNTGFVRILGSTDMPRTTDGAGAYTELFVAMNDRRAGEPVAFERLKYVRAPGVVGFLDKKTGSVLYTFVEQE